MATSRFANLAVFWGEDGEVGIYDGAVLSYTVQVLN